MSDIENSPLKRRPTKEKKQDDLFNKPRKVSKITSRLKMNTNMITDKDNMRLIRLKKAKELKKEKDLARYHEKFQIVFRNGILKKYAAF